jgi:hypothetical protein
MNHITMPEDRDGALECSKSRLSRDMAKRFLLSVITEISFTHSNVRYIASACGDIALAIGGDPSD